MPNLCLEKGYLQMNPFLDLEGNISTIILDVKQNLSPSGLYWHFHYLKRCKKIQDSQRKENGEIVNAEKSLIFMIDRINLKFF